MEPSRAGVVPARQARSRATVERLMGAAEALFAQRGIADVGVADIAAKAGVGVGTFYGRFQGRDAFLAAFYERFFGADEGGVPDSTALPASSERTAADVIRALVATRAAHYRARGPLLKAILVHARAHPDPGFRRLAGEFAARTFARLEALLGDSALEIRHPHPAEALRFAVWLVETGLKDQLLLRDRHSAGLAFDDERLERELTRAALSYLGLGS